MFEIFSTSFESWGQWDNDQISEQVMSLGSSGHLAFEEMCGSTSATDNSHYQQVNGFFSSVLVFETSHHNAAV